MVEFAFGVDGAGMREHDVLGDGEATGHALTAAMQLGGDEMLVEVGLGAFTTRTLTGLGWWCWTNGSLAPVVR